MINMESENYNLPEEIDKTNVLETYKIGFPKCEPECKYQNCENPYCLSDIHEVDIVTHSVEPEFKFRQKNTFVGLNNLGKTCYINSLLQLWFHNINIKNTILNWEAIDDEDEYQNHTNLNEEEYKPETELGFLQIIFALMEFGNQPTINPRQFINSLNIDVNIEEDSEEFQNYLLTLFEDKLNSQSDSSVKKMIRDNFVGEYNSIITCLTCKTESATSSEFREICLNIKGHKTLTDSLKEYFKKEKMVENEKYFCTQCNKKQNAVRQIVLTSLPHLIHLKLIRYVYNSNSKRTTKLNTEIRCPYTIDMENYLDLSNESSKEKHVYNLYGVLIHKGQNTNVGHYITHIKDLKTEDWYEMDDENVKMLNTYNSNLQNENIFKGLASKKPINIQTNEYKTNDAYMLVYMRASTAMKLKTESTKCILPLKVARLVNACNKRYEFEVKNEIEKVEKALSFSNLMTEIKYNKVDNDDGDAISLNWLISLTEAGPENKVDEINNKSITCFHNKLNPNTLDFTKYISIELADKLYGLYQGGPRLRLNSSLCEPCVLNRYAMLCMSNLANEHRRLMSNILECAPTKSYSDEKNDEQTYWLGKESYEFWHINYLKMFNCFLKFNDILPNAIFPINHEELIAACMSLVGILDDTLVYEILIKNDIEKDYEKRKAERNNISEEGMNTYLEILENQRTHMMFKPESEMNSINNLDDVYIDDTNYYDPWTLNDDITCPHGNLCIAKETMRLVPEEVKNILQTFFPKVQFFVKNTKPCSLCNTHYNDVHLQKIIHSMDAVLQEKFLNTLVFDDPRKSYNTIENCPYFCIPRDFLESWRRFIAYPWAIAPKPKLINKSLLCKDHDKLLFEPTSNFFSTDKFASVIITKNEWLSLIDYYQADYGIFVYFDEKGIFRKSIPKVCQTCTLGEQSIKCNKYLNAEIFIQVDDIEDQNWISGNCSKKFKRDTTVYYANDTSSSNTDSTSLNTNNNCTTQHGARMSERKQMPMIESVVISSDSTLLHLKSKIMEIFHVEPSNQYLKTPDGIELLNNEATMEDLNIFPNSVILARFDENVIIQ